MKKHQILFILAVILSIHTNAQQVVATTGSYLENGYCSVSFTVGEPVASTFQNSETVITQGFQQPYNFYQTQLLEISQGWSGISSFINPSNPDIEAVLDSIMDELIIVKDIGDNIYWPEGGVNTLENWSSAKGYWVKMENAADITFSGTRSLGGTLELQAGWNLIPVWSECGIQVTDLFNIPQIIVVKSAAGYQLYWPEKGINTLGNLQPGKAYLVKLSENATIVFPECD